MKLSLMSEYDNLNSVIVHRPGLEIERVTPYNRHSYLFEEIPFLDDMQIEHDTFTSLIRENGVKVFYLEKLLSQVLRNKELMKNFLNKELREKSFLLDDICDRYSTLEITNFLIAGLKFKELKQGIKYDNKFDSNEFIINPLPNMYFMRDAAAVVHQGIIFSNMKNQARKRETNLLSLILKNHPEFKNQYETIFPNEYIKDSELCIEGGDIIVMSDKALAIGHSERTDSEAIIEVAKQMLRKDEFDRVYEVILPKKRNFMHLDTVFTIIDENLVITYPEALEQIQQTKIYRKTGEASNGDITISCEVISDSLISILRKEIHNLEVIEVGSKDAECSMREQWYDAANVFALGPRKVISYNRNKCTNQSLRQAGVEVIEIKGSELVRGLGGPRCMTMPLCRNF